ncbi:MAG: glycosyltransferase family 4 protein [Dehalococcoidia bacterium]|nr:glycosyltransferase family 4 protein [Dehalococcoidia bacterium]
MKRAPGRPAQPRALFVGSMYAGWRTRQLNLEENVARDGRLDADFRHVTGWRAGGLIERLPVIPAGVRGRGRAMLEASAFARLPRPDVVWTSASELLFPYLWTQAWPLGRPLVVELDWTVEQRELFAPAYYGREPRTGLRRRLSEWQQRKVFDAVSLFAPMSNWAADGLRRGGVPAERIRVLHPGLDLDAWRVERAERAADGPLRLLFVGGNFARKGGPLLVDLVRTRFSGRCELDIVTRDAVEPAPGVRVHRTEANSPELHALYRDADLFVMPTTAECFGLVTVEALASGLPVIVTDMGGARDIVDEGETGWLIEPDAASVAAAIERALAERPRLRAMGARGRQVAEARFDGPKNDRVLVDWMLGLAAEAQGRGVLEPLTR